MPVKKFVSKKAAPAKKEAAKPAPKAAAKPAPKKAAPAKKAAPTKKPAAKPAPAKKDNMRVYHVSKRAEDGKWVVKFAGGEKVIKTFATKAEAEAYSEQMAENQGGIVLTHASKGKNKGKIQ
ncbi:MAG: DUF2188 domain-containing protein [Bacilli bacterium]|nr:DUF2188 domain-containing protein [Bacilli bacterium]